jgi:hypothetical protein
MTDVNKVRDLTDAEIRAIVDDAERQALGGMARAAARAGLGTLALVSAICATMDLHPLWLVLLSVAFILGLAAYIRSVARSVSAKPPHSARRSRPVAVRRPPPTESRPDASTTPAVPEAAFIAGGSWSRLSGKRGA